MFLAVENYIFRILYFQLSANVIYAKFSAKQRNSFDCDAFNDRGEAFSIIIQWNCSESRFNTASQRNCDIYFTSSVISKMIFHLFVTKNGDSCNAKQNLKD